MNYYSHILNIRQIIITIRIISFFIILGRVSAQLELYVKSDKTGKVQPIINYNGRKHVNEKISLIFFGLVREIWSQALIGISYSPNKIVTIAGSAERRYKTWKKSSKVFSKCNIEKKVKILFWS